MGAGAALSSEALPKGQQPTATAPDPFPIPPGLEEHVEFWQKVFAGWGRDLVALHDDEYLGLMYEVVLLPGEAGAGLTPSQQRFISERAAGWQKRLRDLARKVQRQVPLTSAEQALSQQIRKHAGAAALFGAAERVRAQRGVRERFRRGLEISGRYDALFREIFRRHGLPEDLAYLPHVESSFQPYVRSSAGAVGIWQFTEPTGRLFLRIDRAVDERLDPVAAARGAARYLDDAYARLGDWGLAVTSYNHGVGGMLRAKKRHGTDLTRIVREYDGPAFGFASRNFYVEFLAARAIARDPERFFPQGVRWAPPLAHTRVLLAQPATAPTIAQRYKVRFSQLVHLNTAWKDAAIEGRVSLPAGVEVWLPADRSHSPLDLQAEVLPETEGPRNEPQAAGETESGYHTVGPQDTLFGISRRYGLGLADLRRLNGIPPTRHRLQVGQRLRLQDEGGEL
jgi:membrane-bound lytic murein transglycosylase D